MISLDRPGRDGVIGYSTQVAIVAREVFGLHPPRTFRECILLLCMYLTSTKYYVDPLPHTILWQIFAWFCMRKKKLQKKSAKAINKAQKVQIDLLVYMS